jgi:hypothetical protein
MEALRRSPNGPRPADLSGRRFGRLAVVASEGFRDGRWRWLCRCDCGGTRVTSTASLRGGHAKSCGCIVGKAGTTHGHTVGRKQSSEYQSWHAMIRRCEDPAIARYGRYGGRGITVCQRWRDSFVAFLADMGPKPGRGYSIERKDNDGNYEPGNCRWATPTEQSRNTSRSRNLIPLWTPGEPNPTTSCACGCGGVFLKYDGARRPRKFITGHNFKGRAPKFPALSRGNGGWRRG